MVGQKKTGKQTSGKGKMTVEEAGRKGGETVKEKYGPEFYSEIGQKGGEIGGEKGGKKTQEEVRRYEQLKEK